MKRLGALTSNVRRTIAPFSVERVHKVTIAGSTIGFDLTNPAGRRFFRPRYAGGKLHEAAATQFIVESLKPGALFLDVGSNLGWFSIIAAHFAGTVYAVDPQEKMVAQVQKNAALNELTNVHAFCAAVGDATGFVDMPEVGRPGTAVNSEAGVKVPVIRLDDYFGDDLMPDVMKIDVEGYEFNVLKGASKVLAHGPAIAIEMHKSMSDFGASPKDVFTLLSDHGYRLRIGKHRSDTLTLNDMTSANAQNRLNNRMVFCDRA